MNVVPTREELRELTDHKSDLCISIYMPTFRGGPESRQNPTRFKNLMGRVESELAEKATHDQKIKKMLREGKALADDYQFWQHQSDSLAFFLSPGMLKTYRLPLEFDDLVVVNDRFHIKPLLPMISANSLFYILALSQKNSRLFRATRLSAQEVDIPDMPKSIEELLKHQVEVGHTDHHPVERIGPSMTPTGSTFHGHGSAADDNKEKQVRFFRAIDHAITPYLTTQQAPLVIAAVDYQHPLYHEANRYPQLLKEGIIGSPERLSGDQLREKAWPIVKEVFSAEQKKAEETFNDLSESARTATQLEDVLPAAYGGRVDALFVALGRQQWGRYDPTTQKLELNEKPTQKNQDLLDYAAMQTFLHGGKVFAVKPDQVPGEASLAAVFRY